MSKLKDYYMALLQRISGVPALQADPEWKQMLLRAEWRRFRFERYTR